MYEMGPFIVAKKAFCNRTAARCLASGAYLASFSHVFLLKNAWKMNSLFVVVSRGSKGLLTDPFKVSTKLAFITNLWLPYP